MLILYYNLKFKCIYGPPNFVMVKKFLENESEIRATKLYLHL